tara:strand:- start:281 stop:436 length:156 start_codon:yes stop_codon:yes gene_type:complete
MKYYKITIAKEVTEVWTIMADSEEEAKINYTNGEEEISETESSEIIKIERI